MWLIVDLLCRPRFQTRSSARRTTPRSIRPRTCPIAALRAWTTSMPLSLLPTRPLSSTRRAPKPRASSKTLPALRRRRGRPRRRPLPRLAGGEAYRLHEGEVGFPRVAVQRGEQEGAGLRGGLQEDEEEGSDSPTETSVSQAIEKIEHPCTWSEICRCGRKQFTTDSLLLSN
jgi:hypothetical protein